ncbi:MAG: AAA family ATPase [Phenylobacterium sp.]
MSGEEGEIAAWLARRSDRVIETSCARVFLSGDRALKLKKRIDLGFLDFRTLAQRRSAIERELAFNRPNAPDIYLATHAVTRGPDGGFALDGEGLAVDYALEMRRFDEGAVLAARPQTVDGDLGEALGRLIARAQAAAPMRDDAGGTAALGYTVASNAEVLEGLSAELGAEAVAALVQRTQAEFERQSPLLEARKAAGFGRRCHADLHLGNILLEDGRPVLFDCIEFNDRLSDIDVQYDVAFLLMDLAFRNCEAAAARALSGWLDESARLFGPAVFGGLGALPLMLSVRAAVRAHVSVNSGEQDAGRAYLAAALAHLDPRPPVLAAVGGLSGVGKSVFAREIAPRLGAPPGAVILRSDEIRKRLAGAGPLDRLPAQAYGPDADERVYAAMFEAARGVLAGGWPVVLDATFLDPDLRKRASALAAEVGAGFEGVWLTAPAAVLARRIGGRRGDASDATSATLAAQQTRNIGPLEWLELTTEGGSAAAAQAWASRRAPGRAK